MKALFRRFIDGLKDSSSYNQRILSGFVLVSLYVLVGKVAGAAKEMAIAWRYGVSEIVDAYVFIFNIINWILSVWFSVLTVVLVPLVAKMASSERQELKKFNSELFGLTILGGGIVGLIAYLAIPELITSGLGGSSAIGLATAQAMGRGMAFLLPFGLIIGLFSAWMMAVGYQRNTLFEAVPAVILLIFIAAPSTSSYRQLIWGGWVGFAVHLVFLAFALWRSDQLRMPVFVQTSSAWTSFVSGLGIVALGQALSGFTTVIDQLFAAEIGVGAISTLSYANRLLGLLLTMGATAIARATLPVFSDAHVSKSVSVRRLALRWGLLMFIAGAGAAFFAFWFNEEIVRVVFERGAFTPSDTESVAEVFKLMLIQVPFYFTGLVLVSALASAKRYSVLAFSGILNIVIKSFFSHFLVSPLGLNGLVLSSVAMYAISMLLLFYFVNNLDHKPNLFERDR